MFYQSNGSISAFLMVEQCSIVYTYILSQLFIAGHFCCLHTLAILNNASLNIKMHVSFKITICFSTILLTIYT